MHRSLKQLCNEENMDFNSAAGSNAKYYSIACKEHVVVLKITMAESQTILVNDAYNQK